MTFNRLLATQAFSLESTPKEVRLESRGEFQVKIAFAPASGERAEEWKSVLVVALGKTEVHKVLLRAYSGDSRVTMVSQNNTVVDLPHIPSETRPGVSKEVVFQNVGTRLEWQPIRFFCHGLDLTSPKPLSLPRTGFVKVLIENRDPEYPVPKDLLGEMVEVRPVSSVIPPNSFFKLTVTAKHHQNFDPDLFNRYFFLLALFFNHSLTRYLGQKQGLCSVPTLATTF